MVGGKGEAGTVAEELEHEAILVGVPLDWYALAAGLEATVDGCGHCGGTGGREGGRRWRSIRGV